MGETNILQKLDAWLRLTRAEHSVISAFGVLAGILIALKGGFLIAPAGLVIALAVPVLINLGAFALNDYFDVESDRKNEKKGRPLVSGEISKNSAIIAGIVFLFSGGLVGFLINYEAGIISCGFAILSFLYNWKLKDLPVLGNLFIAFSMAVAFLFGGVSAGILLFELHAEFWILAAGASLAGFGREIVKSVQDVEGDESARGSKTLPVVLGAGISMEIASACFLAYALFAGALVAYSKILQFNILSIGLLSLSAFAFATLAYLAFAKRDGQNIENIRKASLFALGIGLAAVLAALI